MSALTKALEHIINWFHQSSLYHEPCLQAGLSYEEISEKVKALPFQLSEEVYELYQWKNGDQPGSVINSSGVINSYEFLALESAIEVLTITECYETGAYYLDEIGIIQEDMSKVDEIYLKYNNQAKWFSSTLP